MDPSLFQEMKVIPYDQLCLHTSESESISTAAEVVVTDGHFDPMYSMERYDYYGGKVKVVVTGSETLERKVKSTLTKFEKNVKRGNN